MSVAKQRVSFLLLLLLECNAGWYPILFNCNHEICTFIPNKSGSSFRTFQYVSDLLQKKKKMRQDRDTTEVLNSSIYKFRLLDKITKPSTDRKSCHKKKEPKEKE